MFEKEAEEYLKKDGTKAEQILDMLNEISPLKITLKQVPFILAMIQQVFKDGAEFGYNKANGWHKQDIDDIYDLISKDWDIRYFICIMKDGSRVTAIGNCDECCNGEVSVNLFFEHDDEKYYIDDIVWWKEIVTPKEIKEK